MLTTTATTLVAALAGLAQLVAPAAAVDLVMYPATSSNCNGPSARCTNIGSNICCHQAPNVYRASRCIASQPGGIQQTIYEPSSSNQGCGQVSVRATCQGVCFSNRVTSGLIWNRLSKRSVESSDDEEVKCEGSVEPDVLEFDGRAFTLADPAMTEEQKKALWAHFDARVAAAESEDVTALATPELPAEFDAFEVAVL